MAAGNAHGDVQWLRRAAHPAPLRYGVLSGTFNPPTRAHLALAEAAVRQLRLDEVLFALPETPPHKENLAAGMEDRSRMLRLAIEVNPRFSAAITRHGLLVEIYDAVAPHYPAQARACFLAGPDAAERILLRWPYADREQALQEMFARFDLGVAERTIEGRRSRLDIPEGSELSRYAAQIHPLEISDQLAALSATAARDAAARGASLEAIVPAAVACYIRDHRLYGG